MGNSQILGLLSDADASSGTVDKLSTVANSILTSAVAHQENASESRIGVQVRKGSTKSDAASGLPRFKNLAKSVGSGTVSITAERKNKKTDWFQQQLTKGPKFSITLWKSLGIEAKPKQVRICPVLLLFNTNFHVLGQPNSIFACL